MPETGSKILMTEQLLSATKEIWDKYYDHPFVLGIQNGDLDREKFRFYILQDYKYLEEYCRTFSVGIAKARKPETRKIFAHYIRMLTGDEMDIHRGYMGRFGITREEVDRTPLALDNRSYTSYMLRVAYEDSETEVLAAILSCAYSYEVIAKKMVERRPEAADDPFYGDWIKGYISERYASDNVVLLDAMNRLTEEYTEAQRQHLVEIFEACSRYELDFWQMAWEMRF